MTLRDYIDSLNNQELEDYATRCGTTILHMTVKIKYARCQPRPALRDALSAQSNGKVSDFSVLVHFGILKANTQANQAA
jgi:hypothetical protein